MGSAKKYKVEDGKPRIFPLFTTFHHREETDVNDILIDLTEEQAINLYLMSNLFRNIIDEATTIDDNGYCQSVQDRTNPNYQQRVDACQRIRSIDFSKDSPYFSQVHSSHMKVIMKFVNTIWDKNNKDVGYILSAAMYLEIKSLSQLMG